MYAVIFTAKLQEIDPHYEALAQALRQKAFDDYGCLEFNAVNQDDMEIAISYWPTLDAIQNWKSDSQHQQAQKLGKEKWYQWYKVEVVEIGRSYQWQDKNVPKDIHAADN